MRQVFTPKIHTASYGHNVELVKITAHKSWSVAPDRGAAFDDRKGNQVVDHLPKQAAWRALPTQKVLDNMKRWGNTAVEIARFLGHMHNF